MKVSAITSDGDWRFGRGKNDYIGRSRAVKQKVLTRVRSHQQDWYLDTTHGVPWMDLIGQRGTKPRLDAELENIVLNTEGVLSIVSLESSVSGRDYSARIVYRDVYGAQDEVTA